MQVRKMDEQAKKDVIQFYGSLFQKYGDTPQSCGWSPEGQKFRFEKLINIAALDNKKILDIGCGLGHLYPFILKRYKNVEYTGVDINQKMIAYAQKKYKKARFICRDILEYPLKERFGFAFISGIFNDSIIPDATNFLKRMISETFKMCDYGLAFNFISTYVNLNSKSQACHDPVTILDYCINNITRKVSLFHHYDRCEVCLFLYKKPDNEKKDN